MMNNKTAPFGAGEYQPGYMYGKIKDNYTRVISDGAIQDYIREEDDKRQVKEYLEEMNKLRDIELARIKAKTVDDIIKQTLINNNLVGKDTNPKDDIAGNKLPMHLVSGIVKAYQAIAHFLGNVKYGAWNYRAKGARASVYKAALDRHMDAWFEGEDNDPDDNTPHLANALACINILIEASEAGKLDDDRPPKSNYRDVMNRMTAIMPLIREKYKDRKPVHYREKME